MGKKCAFTICTNSYIGIAKTVRDSFLSYHDGYDFYIVVVDYNIGGDSYIIDADNLLKKNIDDLKISTMKFQYDLIEYCTSIKAYCILSFFDNYDTVIYIDPDIKFYSRFKELDLEGYKVFLTPHSINLGSDIENYDSYLRCGIYNCGFVGFKKSERVVAFIKWWGKMLETECFDDSKKGIYTDQKWMDFAPAFFEREELFIIKNIGCNVAPWNFSERKIVIHNGSFYVIPRENKQYGEMHLLCFVHFSGFNYKKLVENNISHNFRNIKIVEDIKLLLYEYGKDLLQHDVLNGLEKKYRYNYYSNGELINPFHRRLYAAIKDTIIGSPFEIRNEYYQLLKKRKLLIYSTLKNDTSEKATVENKYYSLLIKMYKILFRFLGFDKYTKLLKAMKLYSREDHQKWIVGRDE